MKFFENNRNSYLREVMFSSHNFSFAKIGTLWSAMSLNNSSIQSFLYEGNGDGYEYVISHKIKLHRVYALSFHIYGGGILFRVRICYK